MKYEQRDNSGSLFKNVDKKSEKHPDYSGSCMVDGGEYFFDAWIKESEQGRKWLSFSFKPKQKQAAQTDRQRAEKFRQDSAPQRRTSDDSIPF